MVPFGARAGGLEVPDLGTVAIGRGTAFVAKADNMSAFYYNPAGLSKSKGPNLLLGSNLVHMNAEFRRSGNDVTLPAGDSPYNTYNPSQDYSIVDFSAGQSARDYPKTSLGKNIGPAPMLVFSWGDAFGLEGLALAIGLVPPSSFGTPHYPEDGAGRYMVQEAEFLIMFPGVGVSYAFNRYFQIGGVFSSGIGIFEQSVAIRPAFSGNNIMDYNEDLYGDAKLSVHCKDYFMPSGVVGVLSNPLDWLEIGLAVKFPTFIEAEGTASFEAPDELPDAHLVDGEDKVTLRQNFPWVVRAGARYIHRYFDVEVDFVWENWKSLEAFEIDMDAVLFDGNVDVPMPDSQIPKNFQDTYSVRLGGDVQVWPEHIAIRLGGYYQSSAYPDNYDTFNLDFPFGEQFGIGGGLSWHTCKWLDVNLGYLHVFQLDVEVTEGIVQQQGLPVESGGVEYNIGNRVNNGKYEVALNLFGLSLEGHF
jgi:long-chain fatty acid transport protein